MLKPIDIEKSYRMARETYAQAGVNTDEALETLKAISISLHCWQGDDVGGFERPDAVLGGGGIQVTGNFPGKARNADELRADLDKAYSLLPGHHRLNLHAMYGDFGGRIVERNEIESEHFTRWIDWAKQKNLKIDFNATCFSHPKADSGFTLSSKDKNSRNFWIDHVKRCREISAYTGRKLNSPCLHNLWIPDGAKDMPFDRWTHRALLKESLDEIYEKDYIPNDMKDSLESKLFGIGSESYVVGSHEFYLSYAFSKEKMICLDLGHFHPTESIADKISALLLFSKELLLHYSRGVRWDSDHVVILNDEVMSIAHEIIRNKLLDRIHIALDFFDASMNRVGAWIIGTRAVLKSFLVALLEPHQQLADAENAGDAFSRLALMEESKTMPFGAVWNYYCLMMDVPPGELWMEEVHLYEKDVLSKRS
jgi:L-rhamnose isomerase